jgi:hypothetical protein
MIHELKTWPEYFQLMESGKKTFELRKNDRDFLPGHELLLKEYDNKSKQYTGRSLHFSITYVLQGLEAESFGLKKGYCIMGLKRYSH